MTKESVNEQQPSTLYFNWISRLEYLKIFELFCFSLKHKGFLCSPNKNVVLSHSFLNFLRIFCKLKEQFLRVWENFAPPPGIRPSFFARGQGIRQKSLPRWPGFARSKNFPGGCPVTQLELTETLSRSKLWKMIETRCTIGHWVGREDWEGQLW